jgi:type I protein arginine methyltransferase
MDAYSAAIERTVRPGDIVVDLGCGPGVFALLACKAGARYVYAIDVNGVVEFGRQLAAANGLADRIQFLQGDSRQIQLPERVNVIVADVRGALPLYSHAIGTLEDARNRFLVQDGHLLPARDTLLAAVVELPDRYRHITEAWQAVPHLDLSSGLPLVLNATHSHNLKPQDVMSKVRVWHVLDYVVGAKAAAQARLDFLIIRSGTGHGLGIWFETQLVDNIGYSTGPQSGETVYGHIFLPWLQPLSLREGEIVSVDLRAHQVGSDYVWQWETRFPPAPGRTQLCFQQSTFYGSSFPPSSLHKRTTTFVPVLSESGQAERWILQAMNGTRHLQDIAAEAARLYPQVFRRPEDAFNQVAEIAEKFSR